jgi:hypothetical protein
MKMTVAGIEPIGDRIEEGLFAEQNVPMGRTRIMGRPLTHWELFARGSERRVGKIAKLIDLQSRLRPLH